MPTDEKLSPITTNMRLTHETRTRLWRFKLDHRYRTLDAAVTAALDQAGVPR